MPKAHKRKENRGMTVLELLVAASLAATMMIVALTVVFKMSHRYQLLVGRSGVDYSPTQILIDRIRRDFECALVYSFTENGLILFSVGDRSSSNQRSEILLEVRTIGAAQCLVRKQWQLTCENTRVADTFSEQILALDINGMSFFSVAPKILDLRKDKGMLAPLPDHSRLTLLNSQPHQSIPMEFVLK